MTKTATDKKARPSAESIARRADRGEDVSEFFTNNGEVALPDQPKKRKSGIPTGNAGEYFVMGELLKRGFDAQLADRNTKGYDMLVGMEDDKALRKVQVKTVRAQPWYVNVLDFKGERSDQVTIYVLLGPSEAEQVVRYFIAKNSEVAEHVHAPPGWKQSGFMSFKGVVKYENRWDLLRD